MNELMLMSEFMGRPLTDLELEVGKTAKANVQGIGNLPNKRRISIVGSRNASLEGRAKAREIALKVVEHDGIVVSGLASGIDTAAHLAATHGRKGTSIAVLGTPLNKVYPPENGELQTIMSVDHWIVSQYTVGRSTVPADFAERNNFMATLSNMCIIPEAKKDSGSRYHAWAMLKMKKPVLLDPQVIRECPWADDMIQAGALVYESTQQVAEACSLGVVAK